MDYAIEFEREDDGRWIAEIPSLPGVMAYGATKQEAESKVQAIALRVIKQPQITFSSLQLESVAEHAR